MQKTLKILKKAFTQGRLEWREAHITKSAPSDSNSTKKKKS